MLAGAGRAGGVLDCRDQQPNPQHSCTPCARHKGRAWGSPATAGTVERKGTENGTGAGGKILVLGAGEQRSAKEQPWHWE